LRGRAFAADLAARALRMLEPEAAHAVSLRLLRLGAAPDLRGAADPALRITCAGLAFRNPIGLAAGYDKNGEAVDALFRLGFGFVEVGAVTPRPQAGNPAPRVFRLARDRAIVNRLGFNNAGLAALAARLKARRLAGAGPLGVNLGANKDSADRLADFAACAGALAGLADFFTINVSSPNTPGLRALQEAGALRDALARVRGALREAGADAAPVFVKIAPDLSDADKSDAVEAAADGGAAGLIVSNTTLRRPEGLGSRHAGETGGLSGIPLFGPSTELLRDVYAEAAGRLALIGVGGVACARDAYEKILAGASLVQIYTGLVYGGPSLAARIIADLPLYLQADGFAGVSDAVGAAHR